MTSETIDVWIMQTCLAFMEFGVITFGFSIHQKKDKAEYTPHELEIGQ